MSGFHIVVLISGSGTNLQSIIDHIENNRLPATINAVISNRGDAPGIDYAKNADIQTHILDYRSFPDRESYDGQLCELIDQHAPDLVVLAGYMRILSDHFVEHFHGRLINIHPSLLPRFKGLETHKRALEAKESEHGASVHFVTADLDGGPVIAQATVPVYPDDTPDSLRERVLAQEHRLYPLVIRWLSQNRVELRNSQVYLDSKRLDHPLIINAQTDIDQL